MKRSNLQVMGRLIGEVKPLSGYMLLSILLGTLGHLAATFITVFGGFAILDVLGYSAPMSVKAVFITIFVFAAIRGLLRYGEQDCNHYIAFRILAIFRHKVFQALRRLCPAKLETKKKGNLINLITSDIELLEVFYAHTISPIAIFIIYTVVMTVFIGHYHWVLALIALAAYLTVGAVVPVIVSRTSGNVGLEYRNASGALGSKVLETVRGMDELIQFGAGKKRMDELNNQTDACSAAQEKQNRFEGKNAAVSALIILNFDVILLFAAAMLYRAGQIDFAGVLIPALALFSSFGPASATAALGSTLQNTFAAGNRVLDILDEDPEVEDVSGKPAVTSFEGVSVEDVTFRYHGEEEPVLDHLSLDIPKHARIGIIGKSGSGKSTLLKLLMRFWNVQDGSISISGVPISEINTDDLRNMEAFVTQDTELFHDSIANNLRIAKADATQEELEEACRKASIHDFILSLPQGYDTPVGELGDTLSAGEKQRIGLARAFLHGGELLLLDEPTSNLDSLNEAIVLKSLYESSEDQTILLVSHRPSTMKICEKSYSVEHGRMS